MFLEEYKHGKVVIKNKCVDVIHVKIFVGLHLSSVGKHNKTFTSMKVCL